MIDRYVLTPIFSDIISELLSGANREVQLVDTINIRAKKGMVETMKIGGKQFDCGSVDSYIDATKHEYNKFVVIR